MPGWCWCGSPTTELNSPAPQTSVATPVRKGTPSVRPISGVDTRRSGSRQSDGPEAPVSEFVKVRPDSDGSALPNGLALNGHSNSDEEQRNEAVSLQDIHSHAVGESRSHGPDATQAQSNGTGRPTTSVAESSTVGDLGDHFVSIDFREGILPQKDGPRPATLQELTSKYKRGVFDPSNPTGRSKLNLPKNQRNSGSTPSPKTPPQISIRERGIDDPNFGRTDSDESAPKVEQVLMTTLSTISNATTRSRPQPVSELQGLLGSMAMSPSSDLGDKERRKSQLSTSFTSRTSASDIMASRGLSPQASREQLASEHTRNGHHGLLKGVKSTMGRRQAELGISIASVQNSEELRPLQSCPLAGHERFKVIKSLEYLGKQVYSCQDLHNEVAVIVKLLPRGPSNAKAAEHEIANLRLCSSHPHLIHLHEVFLLENYLGLAMENAQGGNLLEYVKQHQSSKLGKGLSEERARWLFYQIAIAVEFCQKQGIASRQLRLESILLSGVDSSSRSAIPTVMLGHFSFGAEDQAEPIHRSTTGAAQCLAPESIDGGLYDGKCGDIWSMGVLLFAMLTGTYPFSRLGDKDLDQKTATRKLFARIMHAEYDLPQHISREAQDLLKQMLREQADTRIKIDDILVHDFFKSDRKQSKMQIINRSLLQTSAGRESPSVSQSQGDVATILKTASKLIPNAGKLA